MDKVIDWLTEDSNPAVKYRAITELLNVDNCDKNQVKVDLCLWLGQLKDTDWQSNTKGLWLIYNLTAIAECGLTKEDIDIDTAVNRYLTGDFDAGCGDAMGLRALVMLGYGNDERVRKQLSFLSESQLPDGGFLCLHRLNKMKYIPKSCYKDNAIMLMLFAECKKRNIAITNTEKIIEYFVKHNIFYRTDGQFLVLNSREGWRSIDTFYPFEVMRVGIQNIVEAMSILGYGKIKEMEKAWSILESKKDNDGRYILNGTLTKSYLPKEKINQASKWITLYALLANKYNS